MNCTSPVYTDPWRDDGGTLLVIERMLHACIEAGASPRIIAVRGTDEARRKMLDALRAFAAAEPGCSPELHRFAHAR